MMRQLPTFKTRKPVNEPNQPVVIKRANQHAARFLRGYEMRQRHHVKIRNTPDFLLQLLNRTHRCEVDLANADMGNLRRGSHHFTSTGNAMYDVAQMRAVEELQKEVWGIPDL